MPKSFLRKVFGNARPYVIGESNDIVQRYLAHQDVLRQYKDKLSVDLGLCHTNEDNGIFRLGEREKGAVLLYQLQKKIPYEGTHRRMNLSYAALFKTDLSYAPLYEANLTDADLTRADLTNANLTDADLSNADLSNADLSNATLRGAINLTEEQIISAYINENTQLDPKFDNLKRKILAEQKLKPATQNQENKFVGPETSPPGPA